jgi:hypothetical protein
MFWHSHDRWANSLAQKVPSGGLGLAIYNFLTTYKHQDWGKFEADARDAGGRFVLIVGHPWSADLLRAKRSNSQIQAAQAAAFRDVPPSVDMLDAFSMTYPRITKEACDGSHVSCWQYQEHNVLSHWEVIVLAHALAASQGIDLVGMDYEFGVNNGTGS